MIGQTISHYRIEEELGKGGMGVVYRARDERLRRDVALKLLSGVVATEAERRARILAEARAASGLNHPAITTVYEVGEDGDQIFIVMELVSGRTLREFIAQGGVESLRLARLGRQVAEALAVAHAQGVVHGDIKPENIIVQAEDRVKLLDFGIARRVAAETVSLTQSTTELSGLSDSRIAGTLAYLAPEQLRGEIADARADLFSLGVVLYELAAGFRPFPGPTATALLAQILNEDPPALSTSKGVRPAELGRIVLKLLQKQPASRYPSAREVEMDLAILARDLERGPLPAAETGKRAVAVLPFKLLTPNPEDEYLSVALADAVINQLTAVGGLLVRPTSTVMRFAKQAADPLAAGRELNVQVVVDGSIQKLGTKLRVHLTAWNAGDGTTLLSSKHDSEMTDLFGLQDQLADGLVRALGSKPTNEAEEPSAAKRPTESPAAYELFLRASERLSRLNQWDTATAVEMLESATQLDSRFAQAWARLAVACVMMGGTFDPKPRWFVRAEKAVKRALSLDRSNPDANYARGRVLWTPFKKFQNRAALRDLGAALRLAPGHSTAVTWKCLLFIHVGLLEEAREGLQQVLSTDPDNAFALTFLAQTEVYLRQPEAGEEHFVRALRVDPASVWANHFYPTVPLYSRRFEEATERVRAARLAVAEDPILSSYEALLWANRGENRKAEQAARRALKGKSLFHTHHTWHHTAGAYAVMGKRPQALALLRKCARMGLPNYPVFRDDPFLASLHNDAAFLRFMSELKREWDSYRREFGRA